MRKIAGQRFGRLVVLSETERRGNCTLRKCQCDCGAITFCSSAKLWSGNTRSCGCLKALGGARVNKLGNRYGRLVVLEYTGKSQWKCRCDCGNLKITTTGKLQSGHVKSCGCLLHDTSREDLTGVRYGRLTVLSHVGPKQSKCQCDCGNEGVYFTGALKKGNTRSCGCLSNSLKSERMTLAHQEGRHWEQLTKLRWHIIINGCRLNLRSSYELMFAEHLVACGIRFEYEPKAFSLPNGQRYIPDFYLIDEDRWVETKGHMSHKAQVKIDLFREMGYKLDVIDSQEILKYLPEGVSYPKYLKQWKTLHGIDLASPNNDTICDQYSLAA